MRLVLIVSDNSDSFLYNLLNKILKQEQLREYNLYKGIYSGDSKPEYCFIGMKLEMLRLIGFYSKRINKSLG